MKIAAFAHTCPLVCLIYSILLYYFYFIANGNTFAVPTHLYTQSEIRNMRKHRLFFVAFIGQPNKAYLIEQRPVVWHWNF
jgi:hypothetical protein